MKRKLFIGSSTEGIELAKKLKDQIESELDDWIQCDLWNEGEIFELNKSTLESLVQASRKYDYGVLVATKDDIIRTRHRQSQIPRDNVMFEMGMFLGSLGLTRAFLFVEKHNKLPTDYNGITVPYFEMDSEVSIQKAIKKLIGAIIQSKNTYSLRPVASAALALGYFDNFIQKLAKKRLDDGITFKLKIIIPDNIQDIDTTIKRYISQNDSESVRVDQKNERPTVYKYLGDQESYWDIPTTLNTLSKLINIVSPSPEIGISPTKQDWIQSELRNFKGTLDMLIGQCSACQDNVEVLIINM